MQFYLGRDVGGVMYSYCFVFLIVSTPRLLAKLFWFNRDWATKGGVGSVEHSHTVSSVYIKVREQGLMQSCGTRVPIALCNMKNLFASTAIWQAL